MEVRKYLKYRQKVLSLTLSQGEGTAFAKIEPVETLKVILYNRELCRSPSAYFIFKI